LGNFGRSVRWGGFTFDWAGHTRSQDVLTFFTF